MQLRMLRFFLRETLLNIKRNGHSGVIMLLQTAVSLFILGICLIFIFNANHLVTRFYDELEINVYLNDTVDDVMLTQIQRHIRGLDGVGEMRFLSKDDVYQMMQTDSIFNPSGMNLDDLVKRNPFPATIIINVTSTSAIESIAKEIQTLSGIESVNYGGETLSKILPVFSFIQISSFMLALILAGMTLFSIINSIKLAIHSRRQEIKIMRLVGATDRFIKWPFMLEGMFYGISGSALAFILASTIYAIIAHYVKTSGILVGTGLVALNLGILMILIGLLVGLIGSIVSVDKHLQSTIR
jgi:cell division transport system permease protein